MSHYGILLPGFWGGETGRAIADAGGAAAQVLALYLSANRAATMIGLYPISLPVMQAEIRSLTTKQIAGAMAVLQDANFARYDPATEMVWVCEMAKYRLGLHLRPIDAKDNRLKHAHRLYDSCRENPFLSPFFDRYRTDLHIPKRRAFKGSWKPLTKPLQRGSQAPTKPVTGTGTENRDQKETEQVDQDPRAGARRSHAEFSTAAKERPKLLRAAHAYLDAHHDASDGDLAEVVKQAAADCRVGDYNGRTATGIINAVRGERDRRRA